MARYLLVGRWQGGWSWWVGRFLEGRSLRVDRSLVVVWWQGGRYQGGRSMLADKSLVVMWWRGGRLLAGG